MNGLDQAIEYIRTIPYTTMAFEGCKPSRNYNVRQLGFFVKENRHRIIALPEDRVPPSMAFHILGNKRVPVEFRNAIYLTKLPEPAITTHEMLSFAIRTDCEIDFEGKEVMVKKTFIRMGNERIIIKIER